MDGKAVARAIAVDHAIDDIRGEARMAQQDMKSANSMYANFISLAKWGSVAVAIVTALVITIIS